jgi:hypothetical protein
VSIAVFVRMTLNMGINFLIGLVPSLEAAVSAFFKSNSRNLALLTTWQAGQKGQVKRSTLRFYSGLAILLGMIADHRDQLANLRMGVLSRDAVGRRGVWHPGSLSRRSLQE